MTGSEAFVKAPWRYERIEGADHWLPVTAPDEVSRLLIDFLCPLPAETSGGSHPSGGPDTPEVPRAR
jgi:hypothetical protein